MSPSLKAQEYSKLRESKKCYVKLYEDGEFINQSPKKFYSLKILARPHRKNDKYSIFKFKGKTYVTKTSCLEEYSEGEELDPVDEEGINSPDEDYTSLNRAAENRGINRLLSLSDKKYFLHMTGGKPIVPSQKSIFEWEQFNGQECLPDDAPGETCTFNDPKESQYKTGTSVSVKFGFAPSNNNFWLISFKTFSAKKLEKPNITVGTLGTFDSDEGITFTDRLSSLMIGKKYIFNESSNLRPTISILGGVNTISSVADDSEDKYKFESAGLALNFEAGLEIMLGESLGLTLAGGYEFLGTRTFRLKQKDEVLDKGFKTKQDYSFYYAEAGIITYF
jgi:hypothetical protein